MLHRTSNFRAFICPRYSKPAAGANGSAAAENGSTAYAADAAGAAAEPPRDQAAVLAVGRQQFHAVNTTLMLLRMLEEYLAFQDSVPSLGADVARRVVELLKVCTIGSPWVLCVHFSLGFG